MVPLTSVHLMLQENAAPTSSVAELVQSTYPAVADMRSLKREVFGEAGRQSILVPSRDEEAQRIALALAYPASLDFIDLKLAPRLSRILATSNLQRQIIESANVDAMSDDQIQLLIEALVEGLDDDRAALAAAAHEDLGLLIVSRRPGLLSNPAVWAGLDSELLVTLLSEQSEQLQNHVLKTLADENAVDAISAIVAADTALWWRLLRVLSTESDGAIGDAAHVLRATLERVGVAALSGPPIQPSRQDELELLLRSSDLAWGLWRRIDAKHWVRVLREGLRQKGSPNASMDRLAAVALITTGGSRDPVLRLAGWQVAFPYLHEALKRERFDSEAWALVSTVLPSGPAWDRCQRLRIGAVSEIRRDSWNPDEAAKLIRTAGTFGVEMRTRLEEANHKTKRRSWLEEFLARFS
jgi:hypothetical protein